MSTVIAMKEKGVIHMMADSQITSGDTKVNLISNFENFKIFKAKGIKDAYFGFVGRVAEKNLIYSYDFELGNKKVTFDLVVTQIVPKILERLEVLGRVYKLERENLNSTILLISKNKIFLIKNDLGVTEVNDFVAIGSGYLVSMGVLANNHHLKNPKDRMLQALELTSNYVTGVSGPHVYINNKENQFELLGGI